MDKKMRKVTKKIRKAESVLKKAEKENTRLADYDERVRDPMIKKCEHMKKKGSKWKYLPLPRFNHFQFKKYLVN